MFKKNKTLLAGAILIAIGGMNTAYAAVPATWCDAGSTPADITAATAVTVGDVKVCGAVLGGAVLANPSNAIILQKLANLAEKISIEPGLASRAAQDMAGDTSTSIPASAIYTGILNSPIASTADKLKAAGSVALTASKHPATMLKLIPLGEGQSAEIGTLGSQTGLICSAWNVNPAAFAAVAGNDRLDAAVQACKDAVEPPAPQLGDPYVSKNNMGQALIYPYYTVRNGNTTSINVFNTSKTHAIAVKVRFREHQNSRDVLDFNLVLSPNDKWYGNLRATTQGGVKLTTSDKSCTVPSGMSGTHFSQAGYADDNFKDSGDQLLTRLQEGYAEIIPMAWSNVGTDPVYAGALHNQVTGDPANCGDVVDAFKLLPTNSWNTGTQPVLVGDGKPTISSNANWKFIPKGQNPLFGELMIKNADTGVAGGTNAIAIANWMEDKKLTTAQEFPFFLEPTLCTSAGPWDTTNLLATDTALSAASVLNEWANNIGNNAMVDWVVTMPTKGCHVDVDPLKENIQAGSSKFRKVGGGGSFISTPLSPFKAYFVAGRSEVAYTASAYNNEEGAKKGEEGGVSVSPGSYTNPGMSVLPYEANVIKFGTGVLSAANPADSTNLLADLPVGSTNGFTELVFNSNDFFKTPMSLPVVGFAFKSRDGGDASRNYGQMFDHKFK